MALQKPLVSVVVITYNHEQYIRQALDSILRQEGGNYRMEVVIADDASHDATQMIIKEYAKKYPEIIRPILRKKNLGIQPNLVDALRHARGKYVALCEGDDYWISPLKISRQVAFMEADLSLGVCFHPTKVFFDDHSHPDSVFPGRRSNFSPPSLMSENFIPTNSVMYRRLDYNNLKDNLMPFDWYLHGYHLQSGSIGFLPSVMSAYRRHRNGAWWGSHLDIAHFWKTSGPDMLMILLEFRELFADNKEMIQGICEGEFRIISEIIDHNGSVRLIFNNPEVTEDYIYQASREIREMRVKQNRHEKKLEKKINKLLIENAHSKEEIGLLRRDIATYRDALSDTQRSYDDLRTDMKNPIKLLRRVGKHISSK